MVGGAYLISLPLILSLKQAQNEPYISLNHTKTALNFFGSNTLQGRIISKLFLFFCRLPLFEN